MYQKLLNSQFNQYTISIFPMVLPVKNPINHQQPSTICEEGLKFSVQGDLGSGNVVLKPREGEKPEEKVAVVVGVGNGWWLGNGCWLVGLVRCWLVRYWMLVG